METKPILNVCCGGKMYYLDKHDPRVLFCDIRTFKGQLCDGRNFEISPDRISDFRNLPDPDNTYHIVDFDPPHLKAGKTGWQAIKYGCLSDDWKNDYRKAFSECFRVLRPNGILHFKWNTTTISLKEVLALTNEKPVWCHRSGKQDKTYLIDFIKAGII
jgi:SAM-dependent methyltransferase